jgi:hypothetical protein
MTSKIDALINECKLIEENSTYTAQIHFMLAERKTFQYKFLTLLPAIVGGVSGATIALGGPTWLGWLSLIAGITGAFIAILDPEKQAGEHLTTAKEFTTLKHNTRVLYEVFYQFMNEREFYQSVKSLQDRYNFLVSNAPLASNAPFKSNQAIFLEARKLIKEGIHEPDFKAKQNATLESSEGDDK